MPPLRVQLARLSAILALAGCGDLRSQGSTGAPLPVVDAGRPDAGAPHVSLPGAVVMPEVLDLPYVVAGTGGTRLTVAVTNPGPGEVDDLDWVLTGSSSIHLVAAPKHIAPRTSEALTVSYDGSDEEEIVQAALVYQTRFGARQLPVVAVAGDRSLGPSTWENVIGSQGVVCGAGATVAMPTAPFPDPSGPWTDSSVRIFVPTDYRERGSQDLVLHFHGFWASVASVLSDQSLQEHVYYSGANAILIVPQGPVVAPSVNFGKLMSPEGTEALLREALVVLYREGKILEPVLGDVTLTAHSGGYVAVAANLGDPLLPVRQIDLFDAIYAEEGTFEDYAESGGRLRSNYTPLGGTLWHNQLVASDLADAGIDVSTTPTAADLRDTTAVIFASDTSHMASPRIENAYAEELRWGMRHSRRGPRISLRSAVGGQGVCKVAWESPDDEDLIGFEVETSTDGLFWSAELEVDSYTNLASFPLKHGVRVRVRPRMEGVSEAEWQPSNAYRCDPTPDVLVVDHFDRVLGGAWGQVQHEVAAIVGEAVSGGVATVNHRALTEDQFDLTLWSQVIWLAGDSAIDDPPFDPAEQVLLQKYLEGGGHLVASGSEIGYVLGNLGNTAFLGGQLGATFLADDAQSYSVSGVPSTLKLDAIEYGGEQAPYDDQFPDAFVTASGGHTAWVYDNGLGAAVGIPGKAVVVGFGLELIDKLPDRQAAISSLLQFVGP